MKKAVLIKADMTIRAVELQEPTYKSLDAAVGGLFEQVHPAGLKPPFVMIVNEDGLRLRLPKNEIGCYLYQTRIHGHPIVGDAVIMKIGTVNDEGEQDLIGLTDLEVEKVVHAMELVKKLICSEVYRCGR